MRNSDPQEADVFISLRQGRAQLIVEGSLALLGALVAALGLGRAERSPEQQEVADER